MLTPERRALAAVAGIVWLFLLPPLVDRYLRAVGLLRPNYRGDRIPVGYGLIIVLWSVPALSVLAWSFPFRAAELAAYGSITAGLGLLGWIDDRWGDRRETGLRGHVQALFRERRVTTGLLKAAGGLALAVAVARWALERPPIEAGLDGVLIALSANALNLLDLRPGRAGGVFLASATALLLLDVLRNDRFFPPPLLLIYIPALLVYIRDARAQAMLGDTGSNVLGGAAGLTVVILFPSIGPRVGLLVGLVALHVAAERLSLSRVIDANRVLRRIDRWTGKR